MLTQLHRWLRRPPPRQEAVWFDDRQVTRLLTDGRQECIRWDDLIEIIILTTGTGPFSSDLFWVLRGDRGGCLFSADMAGAEALLDRLQTLPGFDGGQLVRAATSPEKGQFICWRRPGLSA